MLCRIALALVFMGVTVFTSCADPSTGLPVGSPVLSYVSWSDGCPEDGMGPPLDTVQFITFGYTGGERRANADIEGTISTDDGTRTWTIPNAPRGLEGCWLDQFGGRAQVEIVYKDGTATATARPLAEHRVALVYIFYPEQ